MLGREVEDVFVLGIGQEDAALGARFEIFFVEGSAVESGDEFANVEAPMRVEIVEDPMEAFALGMLIGDVLQMGGEIPARAGLAEIPHDFAGGDHERSDQATRAEADVFVFAFLGLAGLGQDRGVLSLKDLHAGLFIAANDQLAVLMQDGGLDVEFANVLGFGVEVGVVAVEPIDAAVRFQVGRLQDTPNGRACHGVVGVAVDQDGGEFVEAPLADDAIVLAGFAGGQGDDFELFIGGKSSVADPTAEHLAGRQAPAEDIVFAKESQCCDYSRVDCLRANWKVGPWLPSVRSPGSGRPKLAEWNEPASKRASARELRSPRRRQAQTGLA